MSRRHPGANPLCGGPGSKVAVGLVAWLVGMWLPALCRGWAGGRLGLEGGRSQLGSEPDVAGASVSGLPLLVLTTVARAGDGGLQGQAGLLGPCWMPPVPQAPALLLSFHSSWPLGCSLPHTSSHVDGDISGPGMLVAPVRGSGVSGKGAEMVWWWRGCTPRPGKDMQPQSTGCSCRDRLSVEGRAGTRGPC